MSEEEKISLKKTTYKKLIYTLITASLLLSFLFGYQVGSFDSNIPTIQESVETQLKNSQTSGNSPKTNLVQISVDDDPLLGNPNAPITIIEYGDFQCPFCLRFHEQTLPELKTNYIETGKVNLVWKDFPIQNIHQNAIATSLAGECADDQGVFWELHDKFFAEQGIWQSLPTDIAIIDFKRYADELGMDVNSFNDCLDSEKYLQEVANDYDEGLNYGVSGTPAFFIGNENTGFILISGAQPYSVFESVIESLIEN